MISEPTIPNVTTFTSLFVIIICVRCFVLISATHKKRVESSCNDGYSGRAQKIHPHARSEDGFKTQQLKALVVLGSGGHSTEMFHLLEELDPQIYTPIVYVVANSDTTSIARLKRYIDEARESSNAERIDRWDGRYPIEYETYCEKHNALLTYHTTTESDIPIKARVHRLPRPREVHQSYISSTFSTLYSIYHTVHMIIREQPDLILANGPGLCVPLMYTVFVSRVLGLPWLQHLLSLSGTKPRLKGHCRMIFVESLCRVQTLSLSGKLVYPIVDQFVVHWPNLKEKYSLADVCDLFVCQGHTK